MGPRRVPFIIGGSRTVYAALGGHSLLQRAPHDRASRRAVRSSPVLDLEVIVVDDGSHDATPQILRGWADRPGVAVLCHPRQPGQRRGDPDRVRAARAKSPSSRTPTSNTTRQNFRAARANVDGTKWSGLRLAFLGGGPHRALNLALRGLLRADAAVQHVSKSTSPTWRPATRHSGAKCSVLDVREDRFGFVPRSQPRCPGPAARLSRCRSAITLGPSRGQEDRLARRVCARCTPSSSSGCTVPRRRSRAVVQSRTRLPVALARRKSASEKVKPGWLPGRTGLCPGAEPRRGLPDGGNRSVHLAGPRDAGGVHARRARRCGSRSPGAVRGSATSSARCSTCG